MPLLKAMCLLYLDGDEGDADLGPGEDGDPVDEEHAGDGGDDDEPEPEEDEDLLVDDVDGEDAEAVVLLDGARGAVLEEGALGHLGEDHVHRVGPVLVLHLGVVEHVEAVRRELAAHEGVDDVDLPDHVHEVEHLAGEVLQGVGGLKSRLD